MSRFLKIFLPYTVLLAIGLAVYVSNYHPMAEMVVVEDRMMEEGRQTRDEGIESRGSGVRSQGSEPRSHALPQDPEPRTLNLELLPPNSLPLAPTLRDPVCRMEVNPAWGWQASYKGRAYSFCCEFCRDEFAGSPEKYVGDRCMVCRARVDRATAPTATYLKETYFLCSDAHRREFKSDPAAHFMHTMWGIPPWMYFSSIAFVLVVSFGLFEGMERRGTRHAAREPHHSPPTTHHSPTASDAKDRIDLLRFRPVRWMLTSRPFRFLCRVILVAAFLLIIAAGLFGSQNPALNLAPILTWTVWWGGLVIVIMFAGKAWCYACPWDAIAGWMEKLRFWKKTEEGLGLGLKWPPALRNVLLATLLFVGLTWVELGFGVTLNPRATAYLGIAMLLLAVVAVFLFERKSFCRYGCLVGRVSGLYALFSGVEFRSKDKKVCGGCRTRECVHGGRTAYGCPTLVYPGGLKANTYCIQCCECLQACPHENMAVNLRPWASDLSARYRPRTDEAYLALLMLSITAFHGLTMTPRWGEMIRWITEKLDALIPKGGDGRLISFSAGMAAIMFAPILVYAVLVYVSFRVGTKAFPSVGRGNALPCHREEMGIPSLVIGRRWESPPLPSGGDGNPLPNGRPAGRADGRGLKYHDYFIRYAYALLPIALFYHLAHNLEHLLMEGPKVIPLASDPFGWGWNLFGTLGMTVPPLVSLDVLWILQILLVLVGHVYSLWTAQRISINIFGQRKAAFRSQLPMLAGMILFSVFSLWLLKQPMEMRTSAM